MSKKIIDNLEELKIIDSLEESAEEEIIEESAEEEEEAIEIKKKTPVRVKPIKEDKRKTSVRTEKQIDAFVKVREIRQLNRDGRAKEKLLQEEELKKENEAKIIKKAISIKKKQIKKQIALDEISDDDEPIELIKEKIIKSNMKSSIKKSIPISTPISIPEPTNNYTIRFV